MRITTTRPTPTQGLEQRSPVPARDRGREPVPEAAAGAIARAASAGSAPSAASRPRKRISRRKAFEAWVRMCAELRPDARPWLEDAAVEVEKGAKLQADGSVLLADPADKESSGKQGDAWTFRMKPGAGGWPSAWNCSRTRPRRKVARGNADTPASSLSASIRSKGTGQDRPVAFFHADADHKEPRYANTHEILGVRAGWQSSRQHKDKSRRRSGGSTSPSSWRRRTSYRSSSRRTRRGASGSPSRPSVSIRRDGPRSTRRSGRRSWRSRDRVDAAQVEKLAELYLLGTGRDPAAWAEARSL